MKKNAIILLDIDQTLIDSMSYDKYRENINIISRKPNYINRQFNVCIWERNGLKEFLKYLDNNFKFLGIWTNGSKTWLEFVLFTILKKYININKFKILYSNQQSTVIFRKNKIDNEEYLERLYIKDLNNIYKRTNFNSKNTILIDDNFENCTRNKHNSVPIKKFLILKNPNANFNQTINIMENVKFTNNFNFILKRVYSTINNYNKLFSYIPNITIPK